MAEMLLKYKFILLIAYVYALSLNAQNVKDSSLFVPLVGISYAFQVPGADLAERFGNNSNTGITLLFKTKKNLLLGIDGNYLFSKDIKTELFKNISTSNGYVINSNGEYANILTYERGIASSLRIGKLFSFKRPNPNSGIVSTLGIGILQHKIKIVIPGNNVPQLAGDYKKGYDKLTNGIAFTEFIGYLFLGNNRMINFFGGIEFTQAFTKSRRSYDFDLMAQDTQKRIDLLYGIRVGWILPLYRKSPEDFYSY